MSTADGSGEGSLPIARRAYEIGAYEDAFNEADAARRSARSPLVRSEAAWIAGLAAFQMGETRTAETLLVPLTTNPDEDLAGNASATLGLLALETGRPQIAVDRFREAQQHLRGEDRARAAYHAGIAHQQLGQAGQARTQFLIARAATSDSEMLARVNRELEVTGFTLQLGAFSSIENAEKFADDLADTMTMTRFGPPRVVADERENGETLFLVRLGRFTSLESAINARDSLRLRPVLVTPMTGDSSVADGVRGGSSDTEVLHEPAGPLAAAPASADGSR